MKSNGKRLPFQIKTIDLVVLCVVFALCVGLYIFRSWGVQEPGRHVEIFENGSLVYAAPVDEDQTVTLEGNTVVIFQSRVHMSRADCPDQVCVNMGTISRANQLITCLPNRVVVKLTGESGRDGVDTVIR